MGRWSQTPKNMVITGSRSLYILEVVLSMIFFHAVFLHLALGRNFLKPVILAVEFLLRQTEQITCHAWQLTMDFRTTSPWVLADQFKWKEGILFSLFRETC